MQIEVSRGGSANYEFKSASSVGDAGAHPHPSVKYLDVVSHSVGTRFRCMSSRTLDLWYDDVGEGIHQGTLRMGQDTTTSSYEGHVFYYTPHGQKDLVIGRFEVVKEQVNTAPPILICVHFENVWEIHNISYHDDIECNCIAIPGVLSLNRPGLPTIPIRTRFHKSRTRLPRRVPQSHRNTLGQLLWSRRTSTPTTAIYVAG